MRTRRRATIEDLRVAVQCLPRDTRIAMLEGIRSNEIIVGAYSRDGGVCPMLAAHRNGGRTNMISFAKAWDRFALHDSRRVRPRRATPRELRVLISHLEASLLEDALPRTELGAAIASHKRLLARREADGRRREGDLTPREGDLTPREGDLTPREGDLTPREADRSRPGDPDRTPELRSRPGWAWTRLIRSYNEYERALEWIEHERSAVADHEYEHELGSRWERDYHPA